MTQHTFPVFQSRTHRLIHGYEGRVEREDCLVTQSGSIVTVSGPVVVEACHGFKTRGKAMTWATEAAARWQMNAARLKSLKR